MNFTSTDIAIILSLIAFIIIAIFIIRYILHKSHRAMVTHAVFRVSIPKYSQKDDKNRESNDYTQERLSEIENLFSVLAATRSQRGILSFLYGRNDHFTLEIVNIDQEITFHAALPAYLGELFIQQLHAAYPHAHVDQVSDYNLFQPQAHILAGYLTLRRNFIFPIKTYKTIEHDPLENLTTALSRIPKNGGAGIQFVLRSAPPSWHVTGRKVVDAFYKGTPLRDAIKTQATSRGALALTGKIFLGIFSIFSSSFTSTSKKPEVDRLPTQQQLSQKDQEHLKGIEDKNSKAAFEVNIRIVVSMPNQNDAELHMRSLMDSFGQFNIYEYGNAFRPVFSKNHEHIVKDFIYRNFESRHAMILNSEETVSLFHLPEFIQTPNISWLTAKRTPPPLNMPPDGILLGNNVYRGKKTPVRIKDVDRRRHMYIIGQTGTGKSTLMDTMAIQDIHRGKGVCVIDPHGDLVESIMGQIPKERADDVIYFNPADTDRPMALNMLEFDTPEQKTFVVNEMIKIFDKLYDLRQTGGPMFEQYMRNTMLLMMEDTESGSTLSEIPKVLADEQFRKFKLSKTKNPVVKDFWTKEAQKAGGDASLANMVPYITSKLTQFISNDIMRPIISQQKSSFNFRKVMDEKKILLINLSKGRIGEMNSSLLGMVIVGKILMGALSRVDIPEEKRNDFYLYIDEFQNYTTDSISVILSEARKYRLILTIAHQYLGQLSKAGDTSIKDAVFGNVGTMAAYRIGVEDTEQFAEQFSPIVSSYDLMNIDKYNFYLRLLIDNQNAPAFNCQAMPPGNKDERLAQIIKDLSRTKYGRPRAEVEQEIFSRTAVDIPEKSALPPIA